MNWRQVILVMGLVGGGFAANACVWDAFGPDHDSCVNPKWALYEQPFCAELRRSDACWNPARPLFTDDMCVDYRNDPSWWLETYMGVVPDAGAPDTNESDAGESDAGADASSATDSIRVRMGRCGPDAPTGWTDPRPVWFGPIGEAPATCPTKMGSFGGREYSGLVKPKLDGCSLCDCKPVEGKCSLAANTILFRNAMCGGEANVTTDFGPVENWDGSCMSDHAIVADANCPVCSSIPCVQSIYASGLLESNNGCEIVKIPVPHAITDVPKWSNVALNCSSTPVGPSNALWRQFPDEKKEDYNTCVPGGEGWRTCVQPIDLATTDCKPGSPFSEKVVMYAENGYIDTRSCSACGCESGGACVGTLNIYEDGECKNVLATELLDSNGPACDDLLPPGKAIGSKDLTNLHYVPGGSCKATGGEPEGDVVLDETKVAIWCCLTEESALYNINL